MSQKLKIFSNPDFGAIRTLEENGTVLFCATDVAQALGYSRPNDAVSSHCRYTVKRSIPHPQSPDKTMEMNFIPESDLYRLVFRSKLPNAEKFTDWVVEEVLPAIRKHGAYMTPETIEAAILNPDTLIKLAMALKEEQDKRKALEVENSALVVDNQVMKPKAEYFDELVDRHTLTSLRETAKELGVPPKKFVEFLLNKKYLFHDQKGKLQPYSAKNDGLFEVKESYNKKTKWSGTQTLVTPKGRETFRLLYVR